MDMDDQQLATGSGHTELQSNLINTGSDTQSALQDAHEREITGLKPTDRGRDAWQLLIAAFVLEALFWGFPNSFGIFQAYYSTQAQFARDEANIPVIGTLAQGVFFLGAPFSAGLAKRFPSYQKHQIFLGWPLSIIGLLVASFSNSVPGLIATQGVMYGLGFVMLFFPVASMVNEWWIAKKGMAFGIISAASGLTGIVMPLILEVLLRKYGYRITLRASALTMVILTAPLLPLLKGRLPYSEAAQQPKTDWSFLHKPLFWFYATAMVLQGLGFFIPPVFVSSYAVEIGLPASQGALLLAMMSLAQTLGQFTFGLLSDKKLPVSLLTSTCCVIAAVATATLWGLGKSLVPLVLYSILYGFFAFGFGTMRVAMGRAVSKEQSAVLATFSTFVFLQGIGNVVVGPITGGLMSSAFDPGYYGGARYKETILFVASTSILAGVVILLPSIYRACSSVVS